MVARTCSPSRSPPAVLWLSEKLRLAANRDVRWELMNPLGSSRNSTSLM